MAADKADLAILIGAKPKKGADVEEPAEEKDDGGDYMDRLEAAMEEFDAAEGTAARARAFKALFAVCEAMPHEEAGEAEEA